MVKIVLLDNNSEEVTYQIVNHDINKIVNSITVDKQSKKYHLSNGNEISNNFEANAYRLILGAIERNIYPQKATRGWG